MARTQTEPTLMRWLRALVGYWVRASRYELRGVESLRAGYGRLLAEGSGPVLLCASHVSLADGPLLWWVLSGIRSPWVVADPLSFPSRLTRAVLGLFPKAVFVRQGAGLAGQREARLRLRRILERGEAVLIFPGGTSGEPYSYLVGALLGDCPELKVGLIGLRATPEPSGWEWPRAGSRFDFGWSVLPPFEASRGLAGVRERALSVGRALEGVSC